LVQDKSVTFSPCVATFYERIFELIRVTCPVGYRCDDLRGLFDALAFSELALRPQLKKAEDSCVTG
jgi:hypothetical protein